MTSHKIELSSSVCNDKSHDGTSKGGSPQAIFQVKEVITKIKKNKMSITLCCVLPIGNSWTGKRKIMTIQDFLKEIYPDFEQITE